MAEALFITRDDIVRYTALNGNVDTDKFIQFIKIAQDIHIQNYLGSKLFQKLQADVIAGTLAGNYQTLVVSFVKPMLIHWAMVEYLPFAAYTIANKGVYKHSSENSENVDKNEVDYLLEKERSIAQNYTQRFIDYMAFNQTLFPEYRSNKNNDIFPDSMNNNLGWYI
jgi:hypothetical protein